MAEAWLRRELGAGDPTEQARRRAASLGVTVAVPAALGLRAGLGPALLWRALLLLALGMVAQVTRWRRAAGRSQRDEERPAEEEEKR